ncbi:MAG: BCCT family transporter [Lachnospiraceae bacterium]|nr:BCCT family transporter [Lachnospiraceae bacterium]
MKTKNKNIEWHIVILPLLIITILAGLIFAFPEQSANTIEYLRNFFVNKLGFCYTLLGLFILGAALILAFSKYGNIQLGKMERPLYSNLKWGAMIFTSTMAADILYWSLIEWVYYYDANPQGLPEYTIIQQQQWSSTYPLFHWGPIPWAFYILPAVAYAYRFFVKKKPKESLAHACEPLFGNKINKLPGKIIDIFSVVGLLAGTATTFSLATPLLSKAVAEVFHIEYSNTISVLILIFIAVVFTVAVLYGMKAISHLATACVILFFALLAIFLIFGPKIYIIESGISGIGNMLQNFLSMSTWTDPLRATGDGIQGFPQNWTIFYWAYWIAWFVATPFFIAKISKGRTIRQTILGALGFGMAGTFTSFITFGNFGLFQQTSGKLDVASMVQNDTAPADIILQIFGQLPIKNVALIVLVLAMVAFYASTFDAITLVMAGFCTKNLKEDEMPSKKLRCYWSFIFLILPIALIWAESTLSALQTFSIIAAFPLGIIMLIIVFSFFKELKQHKEVKEK